ncbi:virulence factor [uncultured Enterovirga sp.]|uniref:virulence factor n=1 Tax=uncultured Enterovirga sp. TaxID=2026352 RepID=UPI0035CA3E71
MFAISFDLVVRKISALHPKGIPQAYSEIAATLGQYGFQRVQGSVYLTDQEDLANLVRVMNALRSLAWFPACVRDIRAFRVEQWSDFTSLIKE